jgi:hypothetical protein
MEHWTGTAGPEKEPRKAFQSPIGGRFELELRLRNAAAEAYKREGRREEWRWAQNVVVRRL